jgi:hypothetical protein
LAAISIMAGIFAIWYNLRKSYSIRIPMKKAFIVLAAAIFCLAAAPKAHAALSVVQAQNIDSASTSQLDVVLSITTSTAGNLLVAWCGEGLNDTDNFTISDSASSSWAQVGGYVTRGTTSRNGLFYAENANAVSSITCTYTTPGGTNHPRLMAWEISGASKTAPLDVSTSTNSGASGTSCMSGSITTTKANDIAILACDVTANQTNPFYTAATGYTIPANGANVRLGMEYEILPLISTTSTSMTYTVSTTFDSVYAAFKSSAIKIPILLRGGGVPNATRKAFVRIRGGGAGSKVKFR